MFLIRVTHFIRSLIETRPQLIVGVMGGVQLLGACFFAFYIPLTAGRLERATAALFDRQALWSWVASHRLPMTDNPGFVAGAIVVVASLMFLAYGIALAVCWRQPARPGLLRAVLATAAATFVVTTFALPNQNTDIYNYIIRARVDVVHGGNSHYDPPADFPEDAIYPYASPRIAHVVGDKFSVWTWLAMPLARIGGDDPVQALLVYRTAFLLFNLGNLLWLLLILRRLLPEHTLAGILVYSWNPIVLTLGQSKTDVVMVFFLLMGVYLLVCRRQLWATAAFTASVLIKLITLPLLGLYWFYHIGKRRPLLFLSSLLVFLAMVLLSYAPLWQGSALIDHHLGVILGEAGANQLSRMITQHKVILCVTSVPVVIALTRWPARDLQTLMRRWAVVMLVFGMLLARMSNSWYLIVPVAVVALGRDWRVTLLLLAVTFSAFVFNMWYSASTERFAFPDLFVQSRWVMFTLPAFSLILTVLLRRLWRKLWQKHLVLSN